MKTAITKILTATAAAVVLVAATGCVSQSTFDAHVASADAAIKAAAADAAAVRPA
jgi:hypothetical protein